jgi:hypothetical protein
VGDPRLGNDQAVDCPFGSRTRILSGGLFVDGEYEWDGDNGEGSHSSIRWDDLCNGSTHSI